MRRRLDILGPIHLQLRYDTKLYKMYGFHITFVKLSILAIQSGRLHYPGPSSWFLVVPLLSKPIKDNSLDSSKGFVSTLQLYSPADLIS